MPYVLAVDGGNTKTIALVATLDGVICGSGRGGCSDIYNSFNASNRQSGVELAIQNLEQAIESALAAAGATPQELVASVFNMAGADWPEDYALLQTIAQDHGWGHTIQIQNDALGILHSGSPAFAKTGVAVICGTGAAVGARGHDGHIWHASFWQHVGGSIDLSQKALHAVYQAEIGLAPSTSLTDLVLQLFQLTTVEDVLHLLTRRGSPGMTHVLANLTPLLLDEAEQGDQVAQTIVQQHGQLLGDYALVAARKVHLLNTPFTLMLAGGVLRHPSSLLADALIERVHQKAPEATVKSPRFEPVIGVLFSALEAAGISIDAPLIQRLEPTIPAQPFFHTGR
ncbi:N-acetylglucosamine kinase [Tengunoibacter tsumagoiensis]|uniref:N-acetylglucosamine kinase n=1 Tax=Tengunoibacter tsumagoiensis TaxID=2014871 RepID=A0A402A3Y6_9CHLR|nr:BadF/BadG/BcrA/BcrD ATPase family protein [Tengunoibacter tsumagoiensis]GCE13863.1 N-acetylglucosamine kinase [Tengunoibacter tsumagoiensis]